VGGFPALDIVGPIGRRALADQGLASSEGAMWEAVRTLDLLAIAMDLTAESPSYADTAALLLERFARVGHALHHRGGAQASGWCEEAGFWHDVLRLPDGRRKRVDALSFLGLLPLLAVRTLEAGDLERLPDLARRIDRLAERRPEIAASVACLRTPGQDGRRLLSPVTPERLRRILAVTLDEEELLSPHGIRTLSLRHLETPCVVDLEGASVWIDEPDGPPVWLPGNALLVDALRRFHAYLGDAFTVELPTGSGRRLALDAVADEISRRLVTPFLEADEPDPRIECPALVASLLVASGERPRSPAREDLLERGVSDLVEA
jgi:hypothetical protein